MTPERWQQIEQLFHAALAQPAEQRETLLDAACAGDESLRQEVERLLKSDVQQSLFIEALPSALASAWVLRDRRQKIIGQTIGRYQVLSLLGSGGMGEVYLAEDTALRRKVALKVLPTEFTAHPERLRRFEHEARAASALNHPNIITIHEVGKSDGVPFIATEFIEGQTLREKMQSSQFELNEILEIGAQAAGALATAHAAGIVHRDIKPANIMVRTDGYVKVLDFGLAKLTDPVNDAGRSLSVADKTDPGRVMGTVKYMSPEQALGREMDHRTDIFSLGVVLYEMATGRRPFDGQSDAAIYDAILNKEPEPATESNPVLPTELDRIIRRALQKDRDLRYQAASDLRDDLKRLERSTNSGQAVMSAAAQEPVRSRGPGWSIKALVVFALVVGVPAVWFLWLRPQLRTRSTALAIKNATFIQLTNQPGQEISPSLSADGKLIVYASNRSSNWDIYLQRVGGETPINLTKDSAADDTQPAFSPDGEMIAFRSERAGGGIFVMGATGENARRLTDFGYHPAWSPDGKEIACATDTFTTPSDRTVLPSKVWIISVVTGEKHLLKTEDAVQPHWSPHRLRIAYWGIQKGGQRDIWTIAADGGDPVEVTDDVAVDWNPIWSPDGKYLWFASDRSGSMNLWRVPIDEQSGKVLGSPEQVTTPSSYTGDLSFSSDGKRLVYTQTISRNNLQQVSFDPATEKTNGTPSWITQGSRIATNPDLSPDGEWIAFDSVGEKQEDLFLIRRDGTGLRQLTNDPHKDRVPRWSPDGKWIAFFSDRSGRYESWIIHPDGSSLRQITYTSGPGAQIPLWSPQGSQLMISNLELSAPFLIDADKPWSEQTPKSLPSSRDPDQRFLGNSWSPDGRRIAGRRRSASQNLAGILGYSFDTKQYELLSDFGDYPAWLNDNQRLLFMNQSKVYVLDTQSKKAREVLSVAPHRLQAIGVSHDSRLIYYSLTVTESDIWLMTLE